MPDNKALDRNVVLDFLKLLLSFMVVGIHAHFLSEFSFVGWYLTTNGIFRCAVPLFLLINGYYFFDVVCKNRQLFWLKRIFIVYVISMVCYCFVWLPFFLDGSVHIIFFPMYFLIGCWHLWYFPGLFFAAGMLLLFLRVPTRFFFLSVIFTFLAGVVVQYVVNYVFFDLSDSVKLFKIEMIARNFFFFSYPFFGLGYLINRYSFHERVSKKAAVIVGVLGFLALLLESYVNFLISGGFALFDIYFSLILVCPAVFVLCLKSDIRGDSKNIAQMAMMVYLMHVFVLVLLQKFYNFSNTYETFIVFLVPVFISFLMIKFNKWFKIFE